VSTKENISRKTVLKRIKENGSKKDKEASNSSKKSRRLKMKSKSPQNINKKAKNLQ